MTLDAHSGLKFDELEEILKPRHLETNFVATPCISGTRIQILKDVYSWLEDYGEPNVLWIRGGPGTGKTSLACSILEHLDRAQRCASFFLFRPSLYRPDDYFPSLAYSLAWFHPLFNTTLSHILKVDGFDPHHAGIKQSFEKLVLEPLRAHVEALTQVGLAPVIIIGSLDACYSREHASSWGQLVAALSRWSELPRECKLILTSCNRGDLRAAFERRMPRTIDLLTTDADQDIRRFLERRISDLRHDCRETEDAEAPREWPPPEQLNKLVTHASGYFLWARVAMDFVSSSANPVAALVTLSAAGRAQKLEDLDLVFNALLTDVFKHEKAPPGFRSTIGAIVAAYCPVSVSDLEALFGPRFAVRKPREVCASMAGVMTSHDDDRLSIFHPSFAEYITDAARCGIQHEGFIVDLMRAHIKFAVACLQLMLDDACGLRFNICYPESSYDANSLVPTERIAKCMPFPLEYACKYWAEHLRPLPKQHSSELRRLLDRFLRTKLLFWIEAMSYLGAVEAAVKSLVIAASSIESSSAELATLALEASRFVATYYDAVTTSAPHLYVSALPFLPMSSPICQAYSATCTPPFRLLSSPAPDPPLTSAFSVGFEIGAFAAFKDGKLALVGGLKAEENDDDEQPKFLYLVNLETGETKAKSAPTGHTQDIIHVSLSEDERYAVTTSFDCTLMLWDLTDGIRGLATFQEHIDYVRSADIDMARGRLVSGSDDTTIIVWSKDTKKPIYKPLKGHKDWIRTVRFVESGARIVSASDDKSIRIWDAETGSEIRKIVGHTHPVLCLAISPDETTIASGSEDGAVLFFAIRTGATLYQNRNGRVEAITALSYTPDGAQLVCGTGGGVVRILDGGTAEDIAEPLLGHKCVVKGVTVIDGGQGVVSAAEDGSVIVWDRSLTPVEHPPPPTVDTILALALDSYAPEPTLAVVDRRRIWRWASGGALLTNTPLCAAHGPFALAAFSADTTHLATAATDEVFVWDALTGALLAGPLTAPGSEITALALSRDGQYLLTVTDGAAVLLWDVSVAEPTGEILKERCTFCALAWSSADDRFVLDDGARTQLRRPGGAEVVLKEDEENGKTRGMHGGPWFGWADNGARLARCTAAGLVTVWDAGTGRQTARRRLPHGSAKVVSAAFTEDLARLVYQTKDGAPRIVELATGWEIAPCVGMGPGPALFAFAGAKLVCAGKDGTVRIAEIPQDAPRTIVFDEHTDSVRAIAFSPDGQYLASADDTGALLLRLVGAPHLHSTGTSTELLRVPRARFRALAFTPDGTALFSSDDARIRRSITLQPSSDASWELIGGSARALAVSHDGVMLLTAGTDGKVRLWYLLQLDAEPLLARALEGHTTPVCAAALSPSSARCAAGSADGGVRMWNAQTGALLGAQASAHDGVVRGVCFVGEKFVVSAGEDGALRVWDAETSAGLATVRTDTSLNALALLPPSVSGGMPHLVAGAQDGSLRFFTLASEPAPTTLVSLRSPLRLHSAPVLALAIAPGKQWLASADEHGRIVITELPASFYDETASNEALNTDADGHAPIARLGEDGWLYGAGGARLLWVAPARRRGFVFSAGTRVLGARETRIEFARDGRGIGKAWTACWAGAGREGEEEN
ncbi:hypothetical protein K488DRAFT_85671 [Vararia minispora EC-137]|uniref:Uncharacterized protein n=1 Tax=Vararia minispora EC-137 TaxID=1314806 RepID=A0ACB8QL95_9AGAM|nr:hypothetical protein K488DRAFT_85671 [Vararia minispora EC-137]